MSGKMEARKDSKGRSSSASWSSENGKRTSGEVCKDEDRDIAREM
jgi:hypothetical protein